MTFTGWTFAVRRQVVLALRREGWKPCACGAWHEPGYDPSPRLAVPW